jgi:hypothetical protein
MIPTICLQLFTRNNDRSVSNSFTPHNQRQLPQFQARTTTRYNHCMANQAYLNIWLKDFPESLMLENFEKFLATVPFSAQRPGFTHLEIRAIEPSESPVFEQDLRAMPLDAPSIVELSKDHLNADSRPNGSDCRNRSSWFATASFMMMASGRRRGISR